MKNITIYVLAQTSCAKWIFCDREKAFELGLHNYKGRKITGFQNRADAIASGLANPSFCEPFAVLRVTFSEAMLEYMKHREFIDGTTKDEQGCPLWVVTNKGSIFLGQGHNCDLSMEIVPKENPNLILY